MAFDQARFDSLLAQAAQYQDAKNAAAAAAGASRSDPAAFMNVGNQLANAVNAYQTGNIADVNKALTQSGLTGQQVATGLNLGVGDILGLEQRGVKFAGPPVTGGITTLTNTGAPGGPGTLNVGAPATVLTNTAATTADTSPALTAGPVTPPTNPLYQSLTPTSTAAQIGDAITQFMQYAGGPTAENQKIAADYLTSRSIPTAGILEGYQRYLAPSMFTTAGPGSPQLAGTGTTGTTDLASLNRGFEWAEANQIGEDKLKSILGTDTYNTLSTQYKEGLQNALRPILADGLTGREAIDLTTTAKRYGLDTANDLVKYAGLNETAAKAIFDSADKVFSGIVGNALDPNSTMTPQQRALSVLSLQNNYGLSDADVARYSGNKVKTEDVTNYFAPAKTFQTDFQNVFNDPNSTARDIVSFIDRSRTNGAVNALYGDRLNAMESSGQLGTLRRLADIGKVKDADNKEYDPLTVVRLAGQIGQNFDSSRSSGGAFRAGSDTIGFTQEEASRLLGKEATGPEKVILDMARSLAAKGITDISQLRQGEFEQPGYEIELESGTRVVPAEMRQGVFVGDKQITDGDEFGATYTGKGNTRYNVAFDPATGQPKFYTTAQSSSDIDPKMAGLMLAIISGGIGLPGMLGSGIASLTGGAIAQGTLLNSMIAQGLLSGITGELTGSGSFGRNFLGGAIGAGAGNLVGNALPTDWNPTINRAISGTAGNLARSAVTGQGNLSDILTSGIVSGGLNYGLGQTFDALNLSPAQVNLLTGIVAPTILGQKINPYSLFSTLASTAKPAGATR